MIESDGFIVIENLHKDFSGRKVLQNLSLKISKGEFLSILGASGCGKSTFLRLVAGLEPATAGTLRFAKPLRTSFVFQDAGLLPWRTVEENILLPFEILKESAPDLREILDLVGLTESKDLFPYELSGGMKMRTSIARALITRPELLLMDEPFAALDEVTRFQLQDELQQIWKRSGATILFVTHSISEAVLLSDRVFLLDKSEHQFAMEKKIELQRPREQSLKSHLEYNRYVTEFSHGFKGRPNDF